MSFLGKSEDMPHARASLALVAFTIATRLPSILYSGAIDDENVYAVVANVMVDGGLPYRDAIERKPPALFWLYQAVFEVFGKYNWAALHLVAIVWVLLTMAGLYVIGRAVRGPRAGLVAAGFYSALQPFATAKNLAFNGEVLMNLPIVWAYAIAFGCLGKSKHRAELMLAGGLLALAFLLKQPAAIAAVPLGVYLLISHDAVGSTTRLRVRVYRAALLSSGFAITLGGIAFMLYREGVLSEAYYWTIADHSVPYVFWRRCAEHTALFAVLALPIVIPIFMWGRMKRLWRNHPAEWIATVGWILVSAVGVAAGGRFYPHYYIQLIPPLAVFSCVLYAQVLDRTKSGPSKRKTIWLASGWLGLGVLLSMILQVMELRNDWKPSAPAKYVLDHSKPTDRLFVWGQATRMYLDARRGPASRYIATFPLTGYIFGVRLRGISTASRIVPGSWNNLRHDLARPPAFIIDTEVGNDPRYPVSQFPYFAHFLLTRYTRVFRSVQGDVYEIRTATKR